MASDRFMPRQFTLRGDRLAFSNGIIVLGVASMALLVVFQARTHALIPLYAFGVFVGFTLSQAGMVRHWHRDRSPKAWMRLLMNGVGAVATAVVAAVILATKFVDGAWITVSAIALLVFVFSRVHHHYRRLQRQLQVVETVDRPAAPARKTLMVVVPVGGMNKATLWALAYARTLSDRVTAVHVAAEAEEADRFVRQWKTLLIDTPITVLRSPDRSFLLPMLAYLDAASREEPSAQTVVLLPRLIPAHLWERPLHNQTATRLKKALSRRPGTVIVEVPYHLA
jgi:hypothetical protein